MNRSLSHRARRRALRFHHLEALEVRSLLSTASAPVLLDGTITPPVSASTANPTTSVPTDANTAISSGMAADATSPNMGALSPSPSSDPSAPAAGSGTTSGETSAPDPNDSAGPATGSGSSGTTPVPGQSSGQGDSDDPTSSSPPGVTQPGSPPSPTGDPSSTGSGNNDGSAPGDGGDPSGPSGDTGDGPPYDLAGLDLPGLPNGKQMIQAVAAWETGKLNAANEKLAAAQARENTAQQRYYFLSGRSEDLQVLLDQLRSAADQADRDNNPDLAAFTRSQADGTQNDLEANQRAELLALNEMGSAFNSCMAAEDERDFIEEEVSQAIFDLQQEWNRSYPNDPCPF